MGKFELNIARQDGVCPSGSPRYFHFARVSLMASSNREAKEHAVMFLEKFPEPEWKLSLTRWCTSGTVVPLE